MDTDETQIFGPPQKGAEGAKKQCENNAGTKPK
jgi:hypothetical protein